MKALPVDVYSNLNSNDYTNGGISGRHVTLYLVCDEGYMEVDEKNLPENLVKLVTRATFAGRTETHIEPWKKAKGIGYMFGGNFAYTPDSRFSKVAGDLPIPIFDRQETQEEYDMLSH